MPYSLQLVFLVLQQAIDTASASSLYDIINLAIDGGTAVLLFVVWRITVKEHNEAYQKLSANYKDSYDNIANQSFQSIKNLTDQAQQAYQDAIKLHGQQNERLMQVITEHQETDNHLIRVLTRMEEKLDQPVRCPYQVADRRNINEDA